MRVPEPRADGAPRWTPSSRALTTALAALAALALAASSLTGCAGDPNGFNDADAAYASHAVAHHAQTVQLLNLSLRHLGENQATGPWVDTARTSRLQELDDLERLLRGWDRRVPETGLQHSDEGKHVEFDSRIPGVLTAAQVHAMEQAKGAAFTRMWLRGLLTHERGAVRLAETEIADGQNAETVALAEKDKVRHEAQVHQLERLLSS